MLLIFNKNITVLLLGGNYNFATVCLQLCLTSFDGPSLLEQKQKLSNVLLESSIGNQVLIHCFISWFDDGPHEMQGTPAALFTATQHAGILYAHSLKREKQTERQTKTGIERCRFK